MAKKLDVKPQAHFWTVLPVLLNRTHPLRIDGAVPWSHTVEDAKLGDVRLTGWLDPVDGDDRLLLILHGLGGSSQSRYSLRAARAARKLGLSSLRVNFRGCDRLGEDIYHAGLTCDLAGILKSQALAPYSRIYLLGYSMGGHVSLLFATEVTDPRVRGVAAICSPLDLKKAVETFDQPSCWIYRRHVLHGLHEIYDKVAARRSCPLPSTEVARVRRIYDWDRLVVVPRFDFASPEEYYREMSVGFRLRELRIPAFLLAVEDDPLILRESILAVGRIPEQLEVRWARRGGHVSFPPQLDLGNGPPQDAETQVIEWLLRNG